MKLRARASTGVAIAALLVAICLAGCSTEPSGRAAGVETSCLNLRSVVTNLEALRSWCLDHGDAAGAAAWLSGIDNSLKAEAPAHARVRAVTDKLDAQVKLLSGADQKSTLEQLPDALSNVIDELIPARDSACASV
ncbi:hypothetical protein [Leifsonia soli]|uniref:Putative secreted protein n=1 Tax=Leifsonia soli TaxID=582665 RepID=A0A852SYD2_9MICO|nr:hypothetical protein [Leifsonia soli]NYD74186.1 putative secreted protein [Leifsonia soli]